MNKLKKKERIEEIERSMNASDFWSDSQKAQDMIQEMQDLKMELEGGSKYAAGPATISIYAGAGGDDAEDFVRILFEMYQSWASLKNYDLVILATTANELNGYRNISFKINGKGVYGKLRNESGVHRLVRISPFNSKGKRQTGFALVEVLPEIQTTEFEMDESELYITFTTSGGAGGQNVNKRETAVRIVHPKTGFSVFISQERTQERNKDLALSMMRAKLFAKHQDDEKKREQGLTISDKVSIEWGNQIRSYVFDPYQLVKDHRTNVEVRNVDKVLGGEIEELTIGIESDD